VTRNQYFTWHYTSAIALGVTGIACIWLKWIEWCHSPTWTLVLWGIMFAMNGYTTLVLSSWSSSPAGVPSAAAYAAQDDASYTQNPEI